MLIRAKSVLIAAVAIACTAGISFAQCSDGPPYPNGYPFGQDGNASHPNGYDGYPGDQAGNPIAPNGGPGGNGFGTGDGGCGGTGVNGGTGGTGGRSGANGGCGGNGGDGGDNPTGTGGAGGAGGEGVSCGGVGGDGGNGLSGGNGGCGGNSTGDGSTAGNGGDGGTAHDGTGGNGGCGGNGLGSNSCGGSGGNGGDTEVWLGQHNLPLPGNPGFPGSGVNLNNPCTNSVGDIGHIVNIIGGVILPLNTGLSFKPQFENLASMASNDPFLGTIADGWPDLPGSLLKLGAQRVTYYSYDAQGVQRYACLLHPNSLLGDTIRITLEARVVGPSPLVQVDFGANAEFPTTPSVPVPLGNGWMRYEFTIVRPTPGVAMGAYLDMFDYAGRDIEARLFEVNDLGVKGNVNFDNTVNILDMVTVLNNYSMSGNTNIENGDTNLDGVVNFQDVTNVLNAMVP